MMGAGAGILGTLVLLLLIASGIGGMVCWVIVLVNIFKENVGLGILGIFCGIFAYIYGWVKVGEYGIKKVMVVWTALWIGSMLLYFVMMAVAVGVAATQAG